MVPPWNRRELFWLLAATLASPRGLAAVGSSASGRFSLPPLPYPYDALEPAMDARTMELHHQRHHAAYVAGLNAALAQAPELQKKPLPQLLSQLERLPEQVREAVRNHGGGHYNHSLFWQCLAPKGGGQPPAALAALLERDFGSVAAFRQAFTQKALSHFGSGWAWLCWASGKLVVETTPNQDSPLAFGHIPLLGLDLWEHAYYLKYQWRRAEYVEAFWQVINWPFVAQRLAAKKA